MRIQTYTRRHDGLPGMGGLSAPDVLPLVRRWRPVLRRISQITGDSSFLVMRSGSEALCIHREYGSYPVQVLTMTPGQRQPLGIGAGGLALLAALPPVEAKAIMSINKAALRAYPGTTADDIAQSVELTRRRGWAIVNKAATAGLAGVGVACRDAPGSPAMGLSVVGPIERMPGGRQMAIAHLLRIFANDDHLADPAGASAPRRAGA